MLEMDAVALGESGLAGWRDKLASRVAPPVSARTPLGEEQVRGVIGGVFFVLAAYYVMATVRRAMGQARE
jgi:hypothetical protein